MDAAIASFDPNKPEPLISLLLDEDWLIRRRGLYIFGSLGKKSLVALDAALKSASEPDVMARSNMMDGSYAIRDLSTYIRRRWC
jgi:HEAT repeat protein